MNANRISGPPQRARGFSLVLALFVIIVVAFLGVVAVRLGAGEQQTVSLRILGDRAVEAARTGVEWGAYRALDLNTCSLGSLSLSEGALAGFTVTVGCVATTHAQSNGTYHVYEIDSYAESGTYGRPDYVSRRIGARFTDAP
jgi:MSHA biogenesis protein MshP